MNRKLLLAGVAAMTVASSAYAIPAFARQMNVSCVACHSGNGYPALNRFGRDFKASGYTMVAEKTIDDNGPKNKFMSIPDALNVSVVAEPSVTKETGSSTTVTTNAVGVFIGGRIGEHMGSFVEIGYDDGGKNTNGAWSLANFVVPLTYKVGDNTYGIVPFNTDGHGVTGGFEVLNIRHGALGKLGISHGSAAQGVGVYMYNENFNINYTAWSQGNKSASGVKLASSVKVAYTPQIGDWDLAVAVQYMFGNTNDVTANDAAIANTSLKARAFAFDFQALGNVSGLPVDFVATYANAANDSDAIGGNTANNKTAFVGDLSVGVIPRRLVLLGNYAKTDDGKDVAGQDATNNAEMIGLRYFLMQNVYAQTDITFNSSNQMSDKAWGASMNIAF